MSTPLMWELYNQQLDRYKRWVTQMRPVFITTGTVTTIPITYSYPGVTSRFKGWTLHHETSDGHNTRNFTATLRGPSERVSKTYRLQYTLKGKFKVLNHNNGPQYMPKEVRKWIRTEYKVLYTKARIAGWPGIHGRN